MIVTDVATSRADTAIAVGHGTAMATGMDMLRATIVIAEAGTVTEVAGIGAPLAACKF